MIRTRGWRVRVRLPLVLVVLVTPPVLAGAAKTIVFVCQTAADRVVALNQITAEQRGQLTYWSNIPLGIYEYETTRDLIVQRIDALIPILPTAAESIGK